MHPPSAIAIECSTDAADALRRDDHLIERQRSLRRIGDSDRGRVRTEGVETKQQLKFLQARECNEGQGYYFSHPLNADDFEKYVKARPSLALHA